MRTTAQVQEKIDHLIWCKETLKFDFHIVNLTKSKHELLSTYYRTIDNEISMLRWVLGQVEQTWSDDLSGSTDFTDHFDALAPTEFVHLPHDKNQSHWNDKRISSPGPYVEIVHSLRDEDFDPISDQANEAADRPLLW